MVLFTGVCDFSSRVVPTKDIRDPLLVGKRKGSKISDGCKEVSTDVVRLETKIGV